MNRCKTCVMPDTRPDTPFIDGECAACVTHRKLQEVDWTARKQALVELLDKHDGKCIVPSSGGKDSTAQVLQLLELGADVTVITATTCYLTTVGKANIMSLAKYAKTIEVTPNRIVRAKLNRAGLELVGDISFPEHVLIFTVPFNMAELMKIPLIFFGENPQSAYGGPPGTEEAHQLTIRWRSEFGGFLGLRPDDLIGYRGITAKDMEDYKIANPNGESTAYFLGQYLGPWDGQANAIRARESGMVWHRPYYGNWFPHENLDNGMTGVHDFFGYLKYGYGRLAAQLSIDIRHGRITRQDALDIVRARDGLFPTEYMGVPLGDVLRLIQMDVAEFHQIVDRFTNHELFCRVEEGRPILREFA